MTDVAQSLTGQSLTAPPVAAQPIVAQSADQTSTILKSARRMRDFGLLQPMDGFPDLVSALRAYDMKSGDRHEEVETLQLAMSRVGASFEPETLSALLREELRLPTDAPQAPSVWKGLAVFVPIALGLVFLFGSLYYTRLTIEGAGLVAKMNATLEIDLQAKSDSIVTMLRPLLQPDPQQKAGEGLGTTVQSGDEPATVKRTAVEALHALEDLKYHASVANELMKEIQPTNAMFGYDGLRRGWPRDNPVRAAYVAPTPGALASLQTTVAKLLQALQDSVQEKDVVAAAPGPIPIPASYPALAEYDVYLKQVRQFAYSANGAAAISPQYLTMMYGLERDRLLANIEITNKWTLPVLYGALGAVLYVLARHFNPFVASLNLARVALRITFAMFVAVTISMLFIPANVLSPVVTSSPSGIFLLCFIAGYSTDTFIRFLAKLNSYFAMPAPRNPTS